MFVSSLHLASPLHNKISTYLLTICLSINSHFNEFHSCYHYYLLVNLLISFVQFRICSIIYILRLFVHESIHAFY